jgi:hypothetical protein
MDAGVAGNLYFGTTILDRDDIVATTAVAVVVVVVAVLVVV